jgi:hypothetical protein
LVADWIEINFRKAGGLEFMGESFAEVGIFEPGSLSWGYLDQGFASKMANPNNSKSVISDNCLGLLDRCEAIRSNGKPGSKS